MRPEPRIDDKGRPWATWDCPGCKVLGGAGRCMILDEKWPCIPTKLCLPAVEQMVIEIERLNDMLKSATTTIDEQTVIIERQAKELRQ